MLHSRIAILFGMFCFALTVRHLMTPENPDHVANLLYQIPMAILFFLSSRLSVKACRIIHPAALFLGAAITVWFGNFPVAAIIFCLATLLYYSYGGFRSFNLVQSIISFGVIFLAFLAGIVTSKYGIGPAYWTALVWASTVVSGFYLIWLVLQYFASDIISQNRDLLEQNKKLIKGDCNDVATKGR
jgi:4-hydroxybenzoate polyprenyltransferase